MSQPDAPPWQLYEAFLAVIESGSLSAAARTLRTAQPTVRRHIERLEELLDVVLFTRSPAGLVPTEMALATRPHAEAIAASARAFVRAASGPADSARGTVRVACSEIVGAEVLPAILANLARSAPEIQVELVVSNRNEDLVRREADLAIRMVRPTQTGLVMRRIGTIEVGLFASERYLAGRPSPTKASALAEHALIGGDRDRSIIDALASAGLTTRPSDYVLRTDNQIVQLAALRAGLGIGACQVPLARRDPTLRRVVTKLAFPLETWAVMHEDLRSARRVRTVFDHLITQLHAYAA